ncbi:hypothetical protein CVT91_00075 [Candidatus Atribacteria bacterium HGW-Atribacteria-1]|nr:MAG: hypothetical protein CVT91_00075 [Candidatus Atribacteria bacterium HGW-Atribacteria-1]
MDKDLTDKQILAMAVKPVQKRILFKEYAVSYCNLGLANRDSKTMRKELPAIAKRGAELVMEHILKKTKIPEDLPYHQHPFISVIIYAGVMDDLGEKTFIYPLPTEDFRLEEV